MSDLAVIGLARLAGAPLLNLDGQLLAALAMPPSHRAAAIAEAEGRRAK